MDLSTMTLEQKIGQMFICGFHSLVPDDQIKKLIQEHHLGESSIFAGISATPSR